MNKKHILHASLMLFAALAINSCLDFDDPGTELDIDDVQTGTTQYTGNVDSIPFAQEIAFEDALAAYEKLEEDQLLKTAFGGIFTIRGSKNGLPNDDHAYQMLYSLGPDAYAQYFVVTHKDFPYSSEILTSTYNIAPKFNGGPWGVYTDAKLSIMPLLNHPVINSLPEVKAIFLLYYSLAAQEMADLSGPFTYFEDKQNLEEVTEYNDIKEIYFDIEKNLCTIVECLRHFDTRPQEYKELIQNIMLTYCRTSYDEDYSSMDSFIRLANSLKLRMAMHIVKVEPRIAQEWAEEAVAGGVIETSGQQHGIFPGKSSPDFKDHPLLKIATNWNDLRISASFESLLMSLDHPYSKYLFKPNGDSLKNKRTGYVMQKGERICGIRAGILVGDKQSYNLNKRIAYSTFDPDVLQNSNSPKYFIKRAEVDFLRAEGALRGWAMGGSAEEFYYSGIDNAFMEDPNGSSPYKTLVADYKNLEKAIDYTNVDPLGDGPDWPSVTKIGVKWNEGDDRETKLEKIITQKYLALFPLSTEAWTELRRTGYPKLFPVLNPDEGDGSIEPGEMIRRIPWVPTDPIALGMVEASGIPALRGPDEQATRLWWDVADKGNF